MQWSRHAYKQYDDCYVEPRFRRLFRNRSVYLRIYTNIAKHFATKPSINWLKLFTLIRRNFQQNETPCVVGVFTCNNKTVVPWFRAQLLSANSQIGHRVEYIFLIIPATQYKRFNEPTIYTINPYLVCSPCQSLARTHSLSRGIILPGVIIAA